MAVAVMVALVLRTSAVQARSLQNCGGWSVVSSPDPNQFANILTAVATVSANDVWAVGYFQGSSDNTLAEHWDGTQWSIITSPSPSKYGDNLFGVAAIVSNDVWAVGDYNGAKGYYNTLIEHWDGSAWSVVPSPNPGTGPNSLNAVTVISTNDVWAVGGYSNRNGGNFTLIEHWNGTQWSVVSSPSVPAFTELYAVAGVIGTTQVWTVGESTDNTDLDSLTAFHC